MIKKRRTPTQKRRLGAKKRFSLKSIDPVVFIVAGCVLATLIFAVVLGNILGAVASSSSQGASSTQGEDKDMLPKPDDQGLEVPTLSAFSADMTGALPSESLSLQTADARQAGNALFIPLRDGEGDMVYSSDKTDELSVRANTNLTLSRLAEHFAYYDDYSCGYFESDLSASASPDERFDVQNTELALLAEATSVAFDEIAVRFSSEITRENLLIFQNYLLNLKLLCPDSPIGVVLSAELCQSSDNAYIAAELAAFADFVAVDLSVAADAAELESTLISVLYTVSRYPSRVMISYSDDASLAEMTAVLDKLSAKSYIAVKK